VLAQSIRQELPLSIALCRLLGGASRLIFGQQRDGDDGGGPARRRDANHRMKEEQRNQEQRRPRHVQKCRRPGARQKRTYLVEIAQWLLGENRLGSTQRKRDESEVDPRLQLRVE